MSTKFWFTAYASAAAILFICTLPLIVWGLPWWTVLLAVVVWAWGGAFVHGYFSAKGYGNASIYNQDFGGAIEFERHLIIAIWWPVTASLWWLYKWGEEVRDNKKRL